MKNITARRSRARIVDKLLALGLVAERRELYKKRRKKLAPSSLVMLLPWLCRPSLSTAPPGAPHGLLCSPARFLPEAPLAGCPQFPDDSAPSPPPLNFSLMERSPGRMFARKIWKKETCQRKKVMRVKRKRRTQKQDKPRVAQSFQPKPLGKACLRKVSAWAGDVSQWRGWQHEPMLTFPPCCRLLCSPSVAPELSDSSSGRSRRGW